MSVFNTMFSRRYTSVVSNPNYFRSLLRATRARKVSLNVINEFFFFSFKFKIFCLVSPKVIVTIKALELHQLISNKDFLTGASQARFTQTQVSQSSDERLKGSINFDSIQRMSSGLRFPVHI